MHRISVLATLAGAFALTLLPASAGEPGCSSSIVDAAGAAYLVLYFEGGVPYGFEAYAESNGTPGLQADERQVSVWLCEPVLGSPSLCYPYPTPDTCVF